MKQTFKNKSVEIYSEKKHIRRQKETVKIWCIVKCVNTNVIKKVNKENMLPQTTTSIKSVIHVGKFLTAKNH